MAILIIHRDPEEPLPFRWLTGTGEDLVVLAAHDSALPYRLPRHADEAWAFAGRHGYPLVARPPVGADVRVLRSRGELTDHLEDTAVAGQDVSSVADRMLDADDRMRDHAFHAELVHIADDRLVLELAARARLGMPLVDVLADGPLPTPVRRIGQVVRLRRPAARRAATAEVAA